MDIILSVNFLGGAQVFTYGSQNASDKGSERLGDEHRIGMVSQRFGRDVQDDLFWENGSTLGPYRAKIVALVGRRLVSVHK